MLEAAVFALTVAAILWIGHRFNRNAKETEQEFFDRQY